MMNLKIIKSTGEIVEEFDIEKFVVAENRVRTFSHYSNGDRCENLFDFLTLEIVESKDGAKP